MDKEEKWKFAGAKAFDDFMTKVTTLPTREHEQLVCPKEFKEISLGGGGAVYMFYPSLFDEEE